MQVRPFQAKDAPALARIFFSAVHEIARHHYSPEQISAWAPLVPDPQRFLARGTDGRLVLVATDESGEPLAYGDLESDGHIDHLFCRPDMAGTGVASALYDRIQSAAEQRGLTRIYVEASEPARRFFVRKEFVVVRRRDFALAGVPMHNFAMEKFLTR